MSKYGYHRDVHYWTNGLDEPPCGTLEERFDWSDAIEDVTCAACREALAEERAPEQRADVGGTADQHPLA